MISNISTAFDYPQAELNAKEKRFVSRIRQHGWTGTYVSCEEELGRPDFYYTTGLWLSTGFPELIVFSMELGRAHRLAWLVYEDVLAGKAPEIGVPTTQMLGNKHSAFYPIGKASRKKHLTWSDWFYQRKQFEAVQFLLSDECQPPKVEANQ
jgi:hypothetical protein